MTDTSEQILPCPFCGSIPSIDNISTSYRPNSPPLWGIRCENNNCESEAAISSESKTEAITAWNTRTPRKLDAEVVARVQKEIDIAEARHGNVLLRLSDVKAMLRALDALQKIAAYERGGEISPGPTGDRDDMIGLAREALA